MEIALAVLAVFVALVVMQRRGAELFVLTVRDGRVMVLRGAVPTTLLHELGDVLRSPPVAHATVRAMYVRRDVAELEVKGVDTARAQRLRNVFHMVPPARLRTAAPVSGRNLGQLLGIASLAWYLQDR